MTPEQLDTALDDIARATDAEFSSVKERNQHILKALYRHFPSLQRKLAYRAEAQPPGARTPENYKLFLGQACRAAGPGGADRNTRFVQALGQRELLLRQERPAGDQDEWYPHGAPLRAPLPYPEGEVQWPEETLIVWATAGNDQ
jgi:hypothetical protein